LCVTQLTHLQQGLRLQHTLRLFVYGMCRFSQARLHTNVHILMQKADFRDYDHLG